MNLGRWRRVDVTINHPCKNRLKRISLHEVPDGKRETSFRLQYSQDFANCLERRGKEHRCKTAYNRIKRVGGKRQAIRGRHFKIDIDDSITRGRSTAGLDHFRRRIDSGNLAFSSYQAGNRQRRFTRPGSHIQHTLAANDLRVGNERFGNGTEHRSNDVAVFFPIGSRLAPLSCDGFFFHAEEYTAVSEHCRCGL